MEEQMADSMNDILHPGADKAGEPGFARCRSILPGIRTAASNRVNCTMHWTSGFTRRAA
jgi:hypothetical protein